MNKKTESKYYLSQHVHVSWLWASRLVCLAAYLRSNTCLTGVSTLVLADVVLVGTFQGIRDPVSDLSDVFWT